ncbi:MAG: alpha/beta hydrolase [Chloroflexota bacterium]
MKLNTLTWGNPAADRSAVLIHGVTSNALSWVRVGPALAEVGYYVVAPDLRGHGQSPKADGQYALNLMVDDLAESVPTTPTFLVGHSYGGVMGILATARGVIQPTYLILEDPVLHLADQALPAKLLKDDEASLPRDVEGTMKANPKWHRADAEGKVDSLRSIDWDHMRQVFSENAPWDLRQTVVDIAQSTPTLLLLPEDSFYVPNPDAAAIIATLGNEAITYIPDTGHSIHRDDLESFLKATYAWLAQQSAGV